jgi:hypothetical protein
LQCCFCSFAVFATLKARFLQRRHKIGERFWSDLSYGDVGSGDLTAEFDALIQLSVPIEPDTLIEISIPIFGRLATQEHSLIAARAFSFLKSFQVSIAAVASFQLEPRVSARVIRLLMEDGTRTPRTPRCTSNPVLVTE